MIPETTTKIIQMAPSGNNLEHEMYHAGGVEHIDVGGATQQMCMSSVNRLKDSGLCMVENTFESICLRDTFVTVQKH